MVLGRELRKSAGGSLCVPGVCHSTISCWGLETQGDSQSHHIPLSLQPDPETRPAVGAASHMAGVDLSQEDAPVSGSQLSPVTVPQPHLQNTRGFLC